MRRWILIILSFSIVQTGWAEEAPPPPPKKKQSKAAGYTTRDASILSMLGWGLGLAIGIAALCTLVDTNDSSGSSGSNSHS